MGSAFSTHGLGGNAYTILDDTSELKRPLGITTHRQEYNIKMMRFQVLTAVSMRWLSSGMLRRVV
jgi:hypothetical protein